MSAPTVSSDPPRGHFSVWQRLMRGYGPLAVFAVMLALLSVLVPSKVPDDAELASGGLPGDFSEGEVATDGTATDGTTGAGATTGGDTTGGGTTGGTTGGGGTGGPAAALNCPDRDLQVPGDPYSPPCKAFQGNNGGATHKGVSGTTIKVAFR